MVDFGKKRPPNRALLRNMTSFPTTVLPNLRQRCSVGVQQVFFSTRTDTEVADALVASISGDLHLIRTLGSVEAPN